MLGMKGKLILGGVLLVGVGTAAVVITKKAKKKKVASSNNTSQVTSANVKKETSTVNNINEINIKTDVVNMGTTDNTEENKVVVDAEYKEATKTEVVNETPKEEVKETEPEVIILPQPEATTETVKEDVPVVEEVKSEEPVNEVVEETTNKNESEVKEETEAPKKKREISDVITDVEELGVIETYGKQVEGITNKKDLKSFIEKHSTYGDYKEFNKALAKSYIEDVITLEKLEGIRQRLVEFTKYNGKFEDEEDVKLVQCSLRLYKVLVCCEFKYTFGEKIFNQLITGMDILEDIVKMIDEMDADEEIEIDDEDIIDGIGMENIYRGYDMNDSYYDDEYED